MMFHGLRTVIYHVGDLDRAKEWYGVVLGIRPYFDEPFYVGFDVGGFELGLQPDEPGAPRASTGVVAYWTWMMRTRRSGGSSNSEQQGIAAFRMLATASESRRSSTRTAICSASSRTRTSRSNAHSVCARGLLLYPVRLLLRFEGSRIPLLETREG
jgi:hypothetical protein